MKKEEIYSQIEEFNIDIVNSKETKNNKYYYINSDEALLKSKFINEIQNDIVIKDKLDSIETVMDLCFGSGNLTSHALLENQIQYKNIILNDSFLDDCNQELENLLEDCELKQCDFFNSDCFDENSVDLLIFNPTHGGKPTKKDFINKENKDFDALNKTLSKILKPNSLVIFRGFKEDFQELIFSEFTYKKVYLDGSQSLYVCYDIESEKKDCYEYANNQFIENENCEIEKSAKEEDLDIGELIQELEENQTENNFIGVLKSESAIVTNRKNGNESSKNDNESIDKANNETFEFTNDSKGNLDFGHKNILLKGVPGTGKSKTIDDIIKDKLDMKELSDNVLRINIHSASSNSDLMQGVSISTAEDNTNVIYKEKQGAILNHIFKAIYKPKQPFGLVLEEIQENSLNELIGDLIYLIEDKKRTVVDLCIENGTEIAYDDLFELVNEKMKKDNKTLHYVELPSLVENSQNNTKMIVPNNLFIFCTSNYRDDKKVIEDNLLRRFDVVEIYPTYKKEIYKSEEVAKFLEKLNDDILDNFKDETHPDRYMIGHSNWLFIEDNDSSENKNAFYKALLKVIVEFKEIREIDFGSYVEPILKNVLKKENHTSERIKEYLNIFYNEDKLELKSYKHIIDLLQQEIYKTFL